MKETAFFLSALAALYLIVFGSFDTQSVSCQGKLTQRFTIEEDQESPPREFSNARLGMELQQFRWFAFWVQDAVRLHYSIGGLSPEGRHSPEFLSDYGIPVDTYEDSFVATTDKDELDTTTAVFLDRRSGLVNLQIERPGSEVSFDGFCEDGEVLMN